MTGPTRATKVIEGLAPGEVPWDALADEARPIILKGLARDWPLVGHGLASADEAMHYLLTFYAGHPVVGYTGPPEINGRFHYDAAATGLNFTGARVRLDEFLAQIAASAGDPEAPSFYVGSTDVDGYLPGLRAENDLALAGLAKAAEPPMVSIWIGNHTIASAHYDMSNNIACSLVGRRRFTLFPPEQIDNLYPGPLEPTPGGQVVSMVDFAHPDLDRYPRFAQALAAGEVADLEPGDVLMYPALWWHHVEAFEPFNVMINYWWNAAPAFMDTPANTLLHAMLSLRDRPEPEKRAWRAMFDYYIFGDAERPAAHLPEAARGNLAPLDMMKARRLRALLLNKFNR
ncbi:cupin-like domain-containing protein [Sphingomonas crusticola]|uniref:cupin-like domain-containing protein n=1 Tax=Sphingomonas crusticola TaxID=1697973 RepID=UPI000E2266D7|nr:cupin-like domain-containing protein [Sphingomonas crusticola]